MAGTISLSLTQQLDEFSNVLAGGKLYIIQAGTVSTPQNAYQDSSLTLLLPNPIVLDAAGRLPQFFLADGSVKVRLTDVNGVEQFVNDGILVVGASSGGGGGSPVDPTTVLATGDMKAVYGTGVLNGFARLNGRSIGSATSGATERANADTQALFIYLWVADVNLAVSGGRGTSAAADWAANKTLALPDFRSRAPAGLGDMGNSDNALFSGVTFLSGNSTTLGALLGAARRTLGIASIPPITSVNAAQAISVRPNGGANQVPFSNGGWSGNATGSGPNTGPFTSGSIGTTSTFSDPNSISVTSQNTTGSAFDTVSTYVLITFHIKL